MDWQPSATIQRLRQRAAFIASIRAFFTERDVLEVETPALSLGTVTDVYLDAMQTQHPLPGQAKPSTFYLQTSPEFAMKRLLAAGAPDIFQIAKCFREDEIGKLHNPEFTMLEWYRKGMSMQGLIDEVGALFTQVLKLGDDEQIQQFSYQQAFIDYLDIDPLNTSLDALVNICANYGLSEYAQQVQSANSNATQVQDTLLQALFSQEIETRISQQSPVCITHFPASQASLAKLAPCGTQALRFEFYFRGIELANGFEELSDANIQKQRFESDNEHRKSLLKPERPIDARFIEALNAGLPACSGVAVGLDRLLMLALNCHSVAEVMSFSFERA